MVSNGSTSPQPSPDADRRQSRARILLVEDNPVNRQVATGLLQKFHYDVWYVDHVSSRIDLKILALTVWKVLKREGISQPGHATAEEFMGIRESPAVRTTQR